MAIETAAPCATSSSASKPPQKPTGPSAATSINSANCQESSLDPLTHLRTAFALQNRQTNIRVAALYIKSLIEAANDINQQNPGLTFLYFDGPPHTMDLGQYSLPMSSWDEYHKKLLAQQYTQSAWRFEEKGEGKYKAWLAPNANAYADGFWDNYTDPGFLSVYP
jgi:hypothetical protein